MDGAIYTQLIMYVDILPSVRNKGIRILFFKIFPSFIFTTMTNRTSFNNWIYPVKWNVKLIPNHTLHPFKQVNKSLSPSSPVVYIIKVISGNSFDISKISS
jgi:hypothetical protein